MADGEKQKNRDAMLKSTSQDGAAAGGSKGDGKLETMAKTYKWVESYGAVQQVYASLAGTVVDG